MIVLAALRKFQIRKSQNVWVRKVQIRKESHLRTVRKTVIHVRKIADLQFGEFICGPPTFAFYTYTVYT